MTDRQRENSAQLLESVLEMVGLMLTNYPVISPLLTDLKQNIRGALSEAADALPRITQALQEIEIDSEVTEQFTRQLFEAVPELRRLFQRAED